MWKPCTQGSCSHRGSSWRILPLCVRLCMGPRVDTLPPAGRINGVNSTGAGGGSEGSGSEGWRGSQASWRTRANGDSHRPRLPAGGTGRVNGVQLSRCFPSVPNCVGFQPPSCLKARPYLIILDGPRASAATQAKQGQRSEGVNHGQNTSPGARKDDAGNTSHLARTLFKVLCVSEERDVPLHSQGTLSRDGVPLPTRDPLPEPITLVPTAATPPFARGTPPSVSPSPNSSKNIKPTSSTPSFPCEDQFLN